MSACLAALFAAALGAGTIEFEQETLAPGTFAAHFGASVDVQGDRAVVGAQQEGPLFEGAVHVLERRGNRWVLADALVPSTDPAPGSVAARFGNAVALDGDTVLIGCRGDSLSGPSTSGAAYVFVQSGTSWTEQARIPSPTPVLLQNFGFSVGLSGDTAVVGTLDDGLAYLFERDGTSWNEIAELTEPSAFFGQSVAIDGDTVIIGARGDDQGANNAGAVHVYVRSGTSFVPQQKLIAPDAMNNDFFGNAVTIHGDLAAIGAFGDNTTGGEDSGSVYVYTRNGTSWSFRQKLLPGDGQAQNNFGVRVDTDGTSIAVGADRFFGQDAPGGYLFQRASNGVWEEVAKLISSQLTTSILSEAIAVDGPTAMIGDYGFDNTSGAVFVYDERYPSFCDATDGALDACPCSNPGAVDTGCDLQQATAGVRLDLVRQSIASPNRVTWSGTGFPTSGTPTAIVIRSSQLDPATPVAFGDGLRCVGNPLVRLGADLANAGTSMHVHGHGMGVGSGDFVYQLWFRNTPAMFCTPDAFNLSNGRILPW